MNDEFNMQTLTLTFFAMSFIVYGMLVFARDFVSHWRENVADLRQPWKLTTLSAGTAWLLYGATHYHISDWDIGVSLIMAGTTYVAAPWCARAVFYRRWRLAAGVLVMMWFAVDGSYALWHTIMGNEMLRDANFMASSTLFWLCGFIWLPRGGLRDVLNFRASPAPPPR